MFSPFGGHRLPIGIYAIRAYFLIGMDSVLPIRLLILSAEAIFKIRSISQ